MKRTLTLASTLLLLVTGVLAQPRLTVQTLPSPIVRYVMNVCDTVGVEPGSGGNGQVWNFSSLIQRGVDTTVTEYQTRDVLSQDQQLKFPLGNVVVIDDTTTTIYQLTNGTWRWEGTATPSAAIVAGSDPYDVRPAEVVFNDPRTDTFDGVVESTIIPGLIPRTGSHRFTYDGFGQLILPTGTFNNVARTTQVVDTRDETAIGPAKVFVNTTTTTTTWIQINNNVPLFEIKAQTSLLTNEQGEPIAPPFVEKTVRHRGQKQVVSVDDEAASALTVHPQPVLGDVIYLDGLDVVPTRIQVIGVDGTTMECPSVMIGPGILKIDVSRLASGRYTVVMSVGEGRNTATLTRSFLRLR